MREIVAAPPDVEQSESFRHHLRIAIERRLAPSIELAEHLECARERHSTKLSFTLQPRIWRAT